MRVVLDEVRQSGGLCVFLPEEHGDVVFLIYLGICEDFELIEIEEEPIVDNGLQVWEIDHLLQRPIGNDLLGKVEPFRGSDQIVEKHCHLMDSKLRVEEGLHR